MESIGEGEVLIESTIVGKVRVQNLSALDALRPRIGLRVGVDLNSIHGSRYSGQETPSQYWLTDLGGDLRVSTRSAPLGDVMGCPARRRGSARNRGQPACGRAVDA
jgi:hypothetical protein